MPRPHVTDLLLAGALIMAGLANVLAQTTAKSQGQGAMTTPAQLSPSSPAPQSSQPSPLSPALVQPPAPLQAQTQPALQSPPQAPAAAVPQTSSPAQAPGTSSPAQAPASAQVPAPSQVAPTAPAAPTPHAVPPGPSTTAPLLPGPAQAAGSERRVKAEFLYKFLGYTEFPATAFADAASPVQIGVAGSDDMLAELTRTVAGRTLNGRPITIKPVREGEAHGPLHLLFVAGSDCALAARLLRGITAKLPVTECEGGLQAGSVINFRMVDEHVRFDVSLDAAEKNNVRLSSRLLNVANHVQKGTL